MNKFVALSLFTAVLMAVILTNNIGTQAGETLRQSALYSSIQEANHKQCIGNFERFENAIKRLLDAAQRKKVLESQDLLNVTEKGLNLILDTCMYDIMTGPDHTET